MSSFNPPGSGAGSGSGAGAGADDPRQPPHPHTQALAGASVEASVAQVADPYPKLWCRARFLKQWQPGVLFEIDLIFASALEWERSAERHEPGWDVARLQGGALIVAERTIR